MSVKFISAEVCVFLDVQNLEWYTLTLFSNNHKRGEICFEKMQKAEKQ